MTDPYSRVNNVCLVILASIAATFALSYTKAALIPFVLAIFVYAVAAPVINFFEVKCKLERWLSILIVLLLFILISTGIISLFVTSIGTFINGADIYQNRFYEVTSWFFKQANAFGLKLDQDNINETIKNLPLFDWAKNLTSSAFSILGTSTLTIIFSLFLVAGSTQTEIKNGFVSEIQSKVSRYIGVKIFTSLLTGLLVWIVLYIFNVDLAFIFAVLTVVLNFIPSFGSIVATVLPLPVVLLQFGVGTDFSIIFILTGFFQFFIGNVLEPKLMGEKMDLHPITTLVFLIFWGIVWGIPGMFLAVPITAVLRIVLSRIDATKPIAELFAGRLSN